MATRWLSISKCWYRRNRVSMWSFDQFWCYYGYQRDLTRKRKHYKTLFVLTQVSNFFRQFSFKGLTVLMHSFKSAVVKLQFCWFWLDEDERHTFFRSHFRIAIEQTRWISDPLKNIKMRHFGMIFKLCELLSPVVLSSGFSFLYLFVPALCKSFRVESFLGPVSCAHLWCQHRVQHDKWSASLKHI